MIFINECAKIPVFSGTNPGVAQLGARLTGGQEAVSSSLATRTKQEEVPSGTSFCFLGNVARLEQEGEPRSGSEENSPVDCFRRRVRAGATATGKSRHSDQTKKSTVRCSFLFLSIRMARLEQADGEAGTEAPVELSLGRVRAGAAATGKSRHSDQTRRGTIGYLFLFPWECGET